MSLYGGIEFTGKPDLENIRKLDLLPMRSIREMMQYGMAIDIPKLNLITEQLSDEMSDLRINICREIPGEKLDEFIAKSGLGDDDGDEYAPMNVESTKQMRKLLFEVLGVGKGHELRLTKTGEISTGKRQLEANKKDHLVVQDVLSYRERSKLRNTYSEKLPTMARFHPKKGCWCGLPHFDDTNRIHCDVMTTRTTTGRPATKNPNLQNIPIRSAHGRNIRSAFIASPGTELVAVDFSQLELRLLAHFAKAERFMDWFWNDEDPHTMTAMEAFGETDPKKIDKNTQRAPAKNVNFAIVYGETERGLYEQLVSDTYGKSGIPVPDWLTLEWCREFMRKWFGIHPEVKAYMEQEHYRSYRYGMVWSAFGRVRHVPEVRSAHKKVVAAGLRQAGNMKIQGTGADMLKLVQAEIQDWIETEVRPSGIWCWPLNEVHDELIYETEIGFGDILLAYAENVMSNVLVDKENGLSLCRVPIKAEGVVTNCWRKE